MKTTIENSPLVSIITVVFNGEKFIEQAIKSVIEQDYPRIEYIVIDGGSSDRTIDIIKKYQHKISYWISEKDNGIADAFNKGIKLSTGSIIGLVNSDDWLEPQIIQKIVDEFVDCDILYGEVQFWDNNKMKEKTKSDHKKLRLGMTIAHPASFVKSEVYKHHGFFNFEYKIAMDYDLFLRFFNQSVKFKKINSVVTNMRKDGVSDVRWLKGIQEERIIKNKFYNPIINWFIFFWQFSIFTIRAIKKSIASKANS